MEIDALPLDSALLDHFREQGIEELYPPQAAAVEAGVAEGEDVVLAVPTASGKTFVAQVAMLTADGPGLYVVPLRALATEKYEAFSALPGVSVGVATGDYDSTDADLAGEDVVVATSEKVDAALRNDADWVEQVGCAVVWESRTGIRNTNGGLDQMQSNHETGCEGGEAEWTDGEITCPTGDAHVGTCTFEDNSDRTSNYYYNIPPEGVPVLEDGCTDDGDEWTMRHD